MRADWTLAIDRKLDIEQALLLGHGAAMLI